jgi:hypothetical protein
VFEKRYKAKRLGPPYILEKINKAVLELRQDGRPEHLGAPKTGALKGTYAYDLNRSSRILYIVDRRGGECTVRLLRVCDHKVAYGHD